MVFCASFWCGLMTLWVYTGVVLPFAEKRKDKILLSDPVLDLVEARDTSAWVNLVMYTAIFHFAIVDLGTQALHATSWSHLLRSTLTPFVWSHTLFFIYRSCLLLSCPLHAHYNMVPLEDRLVRWMTGVSARHNFLHDLMCSGHISTLLLFAYHSQVPWLYIGGAVVTAAAFVVSKVHYTIDLLVAPAVAHAVVSMARSVTTYIHQTC